MPSRPVRGERSGSGSAGVDPRRDRQEHRAQSPPRLHDNQIVFGIDGVMLSSRMIDGQFPNYRQLLPDSYEHEVQLSKAEFARSCVASA